MSPLPSIAFLFLLTLDRGCSATSAAILPPINFALSQTSNCYFYASYVGAVRLVQELKQYPEPTWTQ